MGRKGLTKPGSGGRGPVFRGKSCRAQILQDEGSRRRRGRMACESREAEMGRCGSGCPMLYQAWLDCPLLYLEPEASFHASCMSVGTIWRMQKGAEGEGWQTTM